MIGVLVGLVLHLDTRLVQLVADDGSWVYGLLVLPIFGAIGACSGCRSARRAGAPSATFPSSRDNFSPVALAIIALSLLPAAYERARGRVRIEETS